MSTVSLHSALKKLLEDVRKQNRRMLERRIYDLTAAYQIGKEAASFPDLDKCLRVLANRIADLMAVEIVSLMLMDQDGKELIVKLAKGLEQDIVRETRVKVGESVAGWIAKTGEPLLIKDITKDKRFARKGTGKVSRYYTNSLLSVPLKIRNKVIGVINVNNKSSRDVFSKDDLSVLKTVADLAATTIENARFHEEAKALDKFKTDFISNISHELHSPLSAIKESVVLLLDGITGKINVNQRKFLKLAKNNVERLGRLIDQLLELAKIDTGRLSMKRSLFNIAKILEETVALFDPVAKKSEVSLSGILRDRNIEIWGDADKINQVIINLIDNALKYNKPRGTVEVTLEDLEKDVKICVSDTGIGIAPEDLGRIFDRYYRAETSEKERIKGVGLGLFIAKEIVQIHGGDISVDSQPGKGSRFTVILPKDLRK